MLRKRNIIQDSHLRVEKKRETQLLTLLQRCTQIPKDQRLKLRDRIKCKDEEILIIMQRYKKESDLRILQFELRRFVNNNKKQSSENKCSGGNVCWSYRDRSPLQISVQVIPVRMKRIERELLREFEKEMDKELANMKCESHYSIPESSLSESEMGGEGIKESYIQPSHKQSSETVCSPLNRTFVELTDSEMDQRIREGMFKKEKTSEWYEEFMGKYQNQNYQSHYNTYKQELQSRNQEMVNNYSNYHSNSDAQQQQQQQSYDFNSHSYQSQQSYQYSIIQTEENTKKQLFNQKMMPLDLKLKLDSIMKETDTKQQDELFSFRRKEDPKQKQCLNQSTGIFKHQLISQPSPPVKLAEPLFSPKQHKFGQFYKRLKEELQLKD